MIDRQIAALVREAIEASGELVVEDLPEFEVTVPRVREHGDWSTNAALMLQKAARLPPREIAEIIVRNLPPRDWVLKAEIAGPGFINFTLSNAWLHDTVRRVLKKGAEFGSTDEGRGASVNVEFVSINPTGPLHAAHGRHAAVGDSIARLLEHTGHRVTREYYFNDAGAQMDKFGASVAARYLELLGRAVAFDKDWYHGDYVGELAGTILEEDGDVHGGKPFEDLAVLMRERAYPIVLEWIQSTVARAGVSFDVWFMERDLYTSGKADRVLAQLRELGHVYEKDGATWLASEALGDGRDRVLVKSDGSPTYLTGDLPYHVDKAERGFRHMIVLLGPDHHGQVSSLHAGMKALGVEPERIEVRIMQAVHLLRAGEPVKMSRRTGAILAFDELLDEVGVDAARYHFLQASIDHAINFDIEDVKRKSMENPVYYVQYAHARIASILRNAAEQGLEVAGDADLEELVHESEIELMRAIAGFEETVTVAARTRAPHRVAKYAEDLAARFHRFYTDCRVMSEDEGLTGARLALCGATKQVLAGALTLLGVGAPERMERDE